MTVASGHSSKILFQWLRTSSSVVRTGEAEKAFNYAQLLRTVDRPPVSTQQSEVCPQFRQQAVAVPKPCTKVHGSSVANPTATCSVCSHATVTNLCVALSSNLFWTYYMVSVIDTTILNEELWIGCSPSHKETGTHNKTLYLEFNFIHHGWQSNPNPTTATVWWGRGTGERKTKSKKFPRSSLVSKGLRSPLSKGTRRALILVRVALVDSLEDTLWGGISQPHLWPADEHAKQV